MKRVPISAEVEVVMVQNPPTFQELLPDYHYQFNNTPTSPEAAAMYQSLVEFLTTNGELALTGIEVKDEYIKGFKRAIALVRLWVDSMYLGDNP